MAKNTKQCLDRRSIVRSIRQRPKGDPRSPFEVDTEVADFIRNDLLKGGKFYNDGQVGYYFSKKDKKLIEIDRFDTALCLILDDYGLNRSEKIYTYVLANLYVEAFKNGQLIEVHRLAYYKSNAFTVYLFNHQNQIYRISPEKIELVDNGTDGVLFIYDAKATSYKINLSAPQSNLLDEVIFANINFAPDVLSSDDRRLLLIAWFYALFVENLMPTKPILAFIGEKGSGKTTTLRKIGKLLIGDGFNVVPLTNDPKDFDAAITNSALVVFDNADATFKWLDDKLAIAATGGSVQKRELYTTNKLIDFPIHAFVGITSRTPQYRRDDVADRLLIMKVARLDSYIPESVILSEVTEHRNKIMSEVVFHIQEIVRALRDHSREVESVNFRMADFARFALTLAKYAGIYTEMETILTRLSTEQTDYANEDDPIPELLLAWVDISGNAGREVTTSQLCKELSNLAERTNREFPYKGQVQSFGQKLSSSLTYLKTIFKISLRIAGKGAKKYAFRCLP
jgi:hypothetical protein